MPDIFNRSTSNLGGVFTSDRAKLVFGGNILSTLVQQIQLNYSQAITRLYEVNSDNIYYVGGRTQGQANFGRVIGPSGTSRDVYNRYGDVCNARGNTIDLTLAETDCSSLVPGGAGTVNNPSAPTTYSLSFCVLSAIGISLTAQDMIINENMAITFGSLSVS